MGKSCANFELGAADGTAPCMLEKFERAAPSTGFCNPERMRRA
jgi:hypothetical protein